MIIDSSSDFFDLFYDNPKPVVFFESHKGVVDISKAYKNYLYKHKISPFKCISLNSIGLESINIQDVFSGMTEAYVFLTSGANRYKKTDLDLLQSLSDEFVVFTDFPFELSSFDLPYLRTYDPENKWFWDMFNSGISSYDNDPQGYVEGCFKHNGWKYQNGAMVMADYCSTYVNIENGVRKSVPVVEEAKCNIYILGSCIAFGDRTDDFRTIASKLQQKIIKHKIEYRVLNYGVSNSCVQNSLNILKSLSLNKGDYVLLIDAATTFLPDNGSKNTKDMFLEALFEMHEISLEHGAEFIWFYCPNVTELVNKSNFEIQQIKHRFAKSISTQKAYIERARHSGWDLQPYTSVNKSIGSNANIPKTVNVSFDNLYNHIFSRKIETFDLRNSFNRPHEFIEIYTDSFHLGNMGFSYIADTIFNVIFLNHNYENHNGNIIYNNKIEECFLGDILNEYSLNLQRNKVPSKNAGAIVMNCNPFTYGHRYLIENALTFCDYLYIFVVEEDASFFSFQERFQMVVDGVADLDCVVVLPSGKFTISKITFPEYFSKENITDVSFDATQDLTYFSQKIAPILDIKNRFVGQEPIDAVTNEYNIQMKNILPEYGINVFEIPRKECDGEIISATKVRSCIKDKRWDLIKKIVPDSSMNVILKHSVD